MSWIQTCFDKKTSDFCQGRFVSKLFDIFKTKNLENCGIREGSVEFRGFGNSDVQQPTVGFTHFRLKLLGPPVR